MSQVTIDDLRRIMHSCVGEDEAMSFTGDILDTAFEDLGYDSLALLETAAHVKREFGIDIEDDELPELDTPRAFLDKLNTVRVVA